MKIGIISDTHDQNTRISKAVSVFQKHEIHHVFHCGDVTSLESIQWFCEFQLTLSFGNGDFLTGEMHQFLKSCNSKNQTGYQVETELFGKKIGMTHSHLPDVLDKMIESQAYDYLFFGHTHVRSSRLAGKTRLVNPGAAGGLMKQSPSVCILDLAKDTVLFEKLE
jgi:putative phosphoesterase